jgi:DNA-binding CsgD family transcriptional regulator
MNHELKQFGNRLDLGVDSMRRLSRDFCEKLGITLFGYVRVYNDGRLSWLTSNADQDRLLIESGMLESEPLVDTSQSLKEGRYLSFCDRQFPGCDQYYRERRQRFHVDHGMVLVKHQKDYLETCCFSGLLSKRPLYNMFMNKSGLFEAFMEHFTSQLSSRLLSLLDEGIVLSDIKKSSGTPYDYSEELVESLVSLCGMSNLVKLSKREKECLHLLRQGLSYPEIGQALKLSARTIEHYMDSVKNKLGLQARSELVLAADKLLQLGFK